MGKYKTLLFDLDNTLLDFFRAEYLSIKQLFKNHNLPSDDQNVALYSRINDYHWKAFERGEITANQIYKGRFECFGKEVGIPVDPDVLDRDYMKLLSQCAVKMPYCDEILDYCKQKGYSMAVITNGNAYNQHCRMKISGIEKYVTHLIISEEIGAQKPEKAFFDKALSLIEEKDKSKILVIGDSITSDINGAINAGLDSCYIGEGECNATYKIKNLEELKTII